MNETDSKKVYNYPIYPGYSKINTNNGFVNINNGSMGGTHWTRFYIKDNADSRGVTLTLPENHSTLKKVHFNNYENQSPIINIEFKI